MTTSATTLLEDGRKLLSDLVAIPSVNPSFFMEGDNPALFGESQIAEFIADFLRSLGMDVELQAVLPGRANVVGCLAGQRSGTGLLFESHMDTVHVVGMEVSPFEPTVKGGRLYGRGSVDAKGSLAAMMLALQQLAKRRDAVSRDLYFVAAVDEEHQFQGVTRLIDSGFTAQGAIVGEPTSLRLVTACKGVVRVDLTIRGLSAHSSSPSRGVNAIECAAELIALVRQRLTPRLESRPHPLVGPPTLCHTRIRGGSGPNVVPDSCVVTIDRRLVPGEGVQAALAEISEVVAHYLDLNQGTGVGVEVGEPFVVDPAMEVAASSRIVSEARRLARGVLHDDDVYGVAFGSDASKLTLAGIPSVVFGPGTIDHAHTAAEYLALDELVVASSYLARLATEFDGSSIQ